MIQVQSNITTNLYKQKSWHGNFNFLLSIKTKQLIMKFKRYPKKIMPKASSLDLLTVPGVNKPSHTFKNLLKLPFWMPLQTQNVIEQHLEIHPVKDFKILYFEKLNWNLRNMRMYLVTLVENNWTTWLTLQDSKIL